MWNSEQPGHIFQCKFLKYKCVKLHENKAVYLRIFHHSQVMLSFAEMHLDSKVKTKYGEFFQLKSKCIAHYQREKD